MGRGDIDKVDGRYKWKWVVGGGRWCIMWVLEGRVMKVVSERKEW